MRYFLLTAICLVTCLFTACHDSDEPDIPAGPEAGAWTVRADGGTSIDEEGQICFSRLPSYERLTVSIDGYEAGRDGSVILTTDADWLTLKSDTLAADGTLTLTTTGNEEGRKRTALIIFTSSADPTLSATLNVTQLSDADQDGNAGDARSVLYVGYGYDIYAALDEPMAVRTKEPVIDIEALIANCLIYNFEPVHDTRLSRTDMNYYAAQTMSEFATLLTQSGANYNFEAMGCLENCQRVINAAADVSLDEQNIGYGVMTKAVASRVLDQGVMSYLRKYDNENDNSNRLALNHDLRLGFNKVRRLSGQAREKKVEELLLQYGTHIVIQADLGGRIDYTFTMDKNECFSLTAQASQEMQYTIGQLASEDRDFSNYRVSSKKNAKGAIQVKGGSAATRRLLNQDISQLEQDGRIPPEHLQQWMASIQPTATMTATDDMDVIHFELMPLWDLVPSDLRQDFLDATLLLAQRSDCQLPASALNTDIYAIDAAGQDKGLLSFNNHDSNESGSLCRLLYIDGQPIMQVCSEYVPKIRTDERVTIVYPIYNQHIRMNQGLFLGDGIHQPAYVGFTGANCYVNPIDSLPASTVISKFYYVNGNLMLENHSYSNAQTGKNRVAQDDYFYFISGTLQQTPIVKIGSKFWSRQDIPYSMGFCLDPTKKKSNYQEYIEDGVLYTRFYHDIGYYNQKDNDWIWGNKPNTYFEGNPNMRWYLPLPMEVKELYAYLGFSPKALFKGQVSGFNAQFNGYLGIHDFVNNRSFDDGKRAVRYKGQLNIFATRHEEDADEVVMMVLQPDYSLTLQNTVGDWHDDYFPVRPVRGFMFDYPTLEDIEDNTY